MADGNVEKQHMSDGNVESYYRMTDVNVESYSRTTWALGGSKWGGVLD